MHQRGAELDHGHLLDMSSLHITKTKSSQQHRDGHTQCYNAGDGRGQQDDAVPPHSIEWGVHNVPWHA